MSRNTQGGNSGRNRGWSLRFGSRPIVVSVVAVTAIAIAAGVYWQATQRPAQPVVSGAAQAKRHSPEALAVLEDLRHRFGSVPQRPENGSSDALDARAVGHGQGQAASPLLPGVASDFEASAAGLLARFAAASEKPEARVLVPERANGPFELQDTGTGMRVSARLEGVRDRTAEMADGYAVYRDALGPNTTLLRRVMPNGSEDFVSFAEAPKEPQVIYRVDLDASVAGLRNVGNSVELLDTRGTPRLRVAPPYLSER